MSCCQGTGERKIENHWETGRGIEWCGRPVVYGAMILAIALAALGGLGLLGLQFPLSSLNVIGNSLGWPASLATFAAGTVLFVGVVLARCCFYYKS